MAISMKVSINASIQRGPWGGANAVAAAIARHLLAAGFDVVDSLDSPGIDLILMVHPDKKLAIVRYGIEEIEDYIALNPNTVLLHRINTSDERRGSKGEDDLILAANSKADYTVFISQYLRTLYISRKFNPARPNSVIYNGANTGVFNPTDSAVYNYGDKLKIVTHHWSSNFMKGFDIYERLDLLLATKPFKDLFEFTYIGNIPPGVEFRNTNVVAPLSGQELAIELKRNHLYLTASRNEPAGMHHIEGMMCGLPVLYLNSGALPEYCSPYGMEFSLINFEDRLMESWRNIVKLREAVLRCNYTDELMALQYERLITELITERKREPRELPGILKRFARKLVSGPCKKARKLYALMIKAKRGG